MRIRLLSCLIIFLLLIIGCSQQDDATPPPATNVVPTTVDTADDPTLEPTAIQTIDQATAVPDDDGVLTIAVDVPNRDPRYADFDNFGNIVGLDADLMTAIAEIAQLDYEIVATPFDNIMEGLRSGVFDVGLSAEPRLDASQTGIAYTQPYLETQEQLLVRADEKTVTNLSEIEAQMLVAVADERSEAASRAELFAPDDQLRLFSTVPNAVQALSDGMVRAAIVDSSQAAFYVNRYPQRFKITGDVVRETRQLSMVVREDNVELLAQLDDALEQLGEQTAAIANNWLVDRTPISGGDISLIGTPEDRVLIGVVGTTGDLDPSSNTFGFINWEIKQNTMSGLLRYDENNELVPALAAALPEVSADGLEYTFTLREGLLFPDGTLLDADAVRTSLIRASQNGNSQLNSYLKDSNLDQFADSDSIQTIGTNQIVFQLEAPRSQFITFLATPPYFILNPSCETIAFDPLVSCNGIGPYTITAYEADRLVRMEANPQWTVTTPIMSSVELRFYRNAAELSAALLDEQIDIAWHGGAADSSLGNLQQWAGANIFKSYLVFEQSEEPWDDERVRQAAAYAIDRTALAELFNGTRTPLAGPVPDGVPGSAPAAPAQNLSAAISLLNAAGYSPLNPLEIDLWHLNDGRYTDLEDEYAALIAAQLEQTGIFEVTLNGAGWGSYSAQMSACNLPAFLLGWPGGSAQRYLDPMLWMRYFVFNADQVCSNYESEDMNALMVELFETTDPEERLAKQAAVQALWAEELPTLDLTQAQNWAYSSADITALTIDSLGIMRYETLEK